MTSTLTRRTALKGAGAVTLARLATPMPTWAQAFPIKPIRIVHGYNAGTNPDVIAASSARR